MEYFGPQICEGKLSWRAKKKDLALEVAFFQGDAMEIDEPTTPVRADSTMNSTERIFEPFSDEWFADLDDSIDTITNTFNELRMSQSDPEPEDHDDIIDAECGLIDIQNELMDCLAALQSAKSGIKTTGDSRGHRKKDGDSDDRKRDRDRKKQNRPTGSKHFFTKTHDGCQKRDASRAPAKSTGSRFALSPGEKAMKELFRWWRLCGPGSVRDAKRLGEARLTEVDGRLIP